MQLRIIYRGNELLTLSTEIDTRVLQVKADIAKALGIQQREQVLTSRGVFLDDSKRLRDYSIPESGFVELNLPLNHKKFFPIRVVISPAEVHSIPICENTTVAELRAKIAKKAGDQDINLFNAFLVYSHWILEDSRRLDEYNVSENDCIVVAHGLDQRRQMPTEPYDYCDNFSVESLPSPSLRLITIHFLSEVTDPFTLMVDPSKPLNTICQSVEGITKIPTECQQFIMAGNKLNAELEPNLLKITEGESLFLSDNRLGRIYHPTRPTTVEQKDKVVIFDLGQHHIRMAFPCQCTIKELRRALQAHPLVNGQRIDLFFKNIYLEPSRYLHEYGIDNESVIRVETLFL